MLGLLVSVADMNYSLSDSSLLHLSSSFLNEKQGKCMHYNSKNEEQEAIVVKAWIMALD